MLRHRHGIVGRDVIEKELEGAVIRRRTGSPAVIGIEKEKQQIVGVSGAVRDVEGQEQIDAVVERMDRDRRRRRRAEKFVAVVSPNFSTTCCLSRLPR
jgi:hypothetical protein